MKNLIISALLAFATVAGAATWNTSRGMGNPQDDWLIYGSGTPIGVQGSVTSNGLYYITSAKASGQAVLDKVVIDTDTLVATLEWYIPTNTWTVAATEGCGTNQIWVTSTNLTMATNDIFVLRSVSSDSYQLLVLGGHTTASGIVRTNGAYNQVQFFQTTTNIPTAGDILYKMAKVQSYIPNAMGNVTNSTPVPFNAYVFASGYHPFKFAAPLGAPGLLWLNTCSNLSVCDLNVSGEYFVRPRR